MIFLKHTSPTSHCFEDDSFRHFRLYTSAKGSVLSASLRGGVAPPTCLRLRDNLTIDYDGTSVYRTPSHQYER